ncbi:MAG TPA: tetratricopeptide repeat protein [Methanospirillum sp.]|nr:tetratricopeptide repeat protein [Methanospirillum sp.]
MEPEDLLTLYQKGLRLFRSENYGEAIELFSAVVEADETHHKAWNALGVACTKVGRYEDAALCFENALSLAPDTETYIKNRDKNKGHLKKSGFTGNLAQTLSSTLDAIPFDLIPVDRRYLIAGAGVFGLLLLMVILAFTGVLFHPAPSESAKLMNFSTMRSGDQIIVTYLGGGEPGTISTFNWTIGGIPSTNGSGQGTRELGITPGSAALVNIPAMPGLNTTAEIRVIVTATFTDKVTKTVSDVTLPAPPPQPASEMAVSATQAAPIYSAKFSPDVVVYTKADNGYWIINQIGQNDTYSLSSAARLPDGSWTSKDGAIINKSMEDFDQNAVSLGTRNIGGTADGLGGFYPPPATGIPPNHPNPVYLPGDLISDRPSGDDGVLVILNYDLATDQYLADPISRYYTGEWGYRPDSAGEWYIRSWVESRYPYRSEHLTISDIGVGSDSAPPRGVVKYSPGDLIAAEPSGVDQEYVIISYNESSDQYQYDTISSGYAGGWRLGQNPVWEKRVFIERDYPYKTRTIDLSLIRS